MVNVRALAQDSVSRIGGNATMVDYLVQMAQIESGNNPNARNPASSAGGLYQQIDSNWRAYGNGGNRFNPAHSTDAALRFALDNGRVIRNVTGREPTEGEYYLAHFAGAGGVSRILRADPNTPLSEIPGGQAIINSNRGARLASGQRIATFTAGDLRRWADEKMGADIGGAAAYNSARASGNTTDEQDTAEAERRRRQLTELGYDGESANRLSVDTLLGSIFIKILENIFDSSVQVPQVDGRDVSIDSNRAAPSATAAREAAESVRASGTRLEVTNVERGETPSPSPAPTTAAARTPERTPTPA